MIVRVLGCLWEVDDVATAELMKCFYQGVLAEKAAGRGIASGPGCHVEAAALVLAVLLGRLCPLGRLAVTGMLRRDHSDLGVIQPSQTKWPGR
jgi:hypothetical protein